MKIYDKFDKFVKYMKYMKYMTSGRPVKGDCYAILEGGTLQTWGKWLKTKHLINLRKA